MEDDEKPNKNCGEKDEEPNTTIAIIGEIARQGQITNSENDEKLITKIVTIGTILGTNRWKWWEAKHQNCENRGNSETRPNNK